MVVAYVSLLFNNVFIFNPGVAIVFLVLLLTNVLGELSFLQLSLHKLSPLK